LQDGVEILARTPWVLSALLDGLSEGWGSGDEGPETWSPFDVVGHLIHGEKTDWIPRARIILEHGTSRTFEPFDRVAMLATSRDRTLEQLLEEFARLRQRNLEELAALGLTDDDLERRGMHPELGEVTLGQLLSTWVTHDLGHLAQVSRTMARQYKGEVGAWREYLPVLA
jgi:hypothetical protein